jgi:integrase
MKILRQKLTKFADGERFPVLLFPDCPAFLPNIYFVYERRPRAAANTLIKDGRAIMHLYAWAAREALDIEGRFAAGQFLTLPEIQNLSDACRLPYEAILPNSPTQRPRVVVPMHGRRKIASETSYARVMAIEEYLNWLATQAIYRLPASSTEESRNLEKARDEMCKRLRKRRGGKRGRSVVGAREGLAEEDLDLLLEIITPAGEGGGPLPHSIKDYHWSEKNPWKRTPVRVRNFLMIRTLLDLGIRAGELLNMKITDFNFEKNKVLIARRPDDPDDPRTREPNVKTLDRILPFDGALGRMLLIYISQVRRRQWMPDARRDHLFLWVSEDGKPLSDSSLRKIWHTLRIRVPNLPEDICSHVLRHTWNDRFSRKKDRDRTSRPTLQEQAMEEQERSYIMGWKPTSGTAQVYTRRHVKEKADQGLLAMQRDAWNSTK